MKVSKQKHTSAEYRDALQKFYAQYCPEKLGNMDQVLHAWSGREEELFHALEKKFNFPQDSILHGQLFRNALGNFYQQPQLNPGGVMMQQQQGGTYFQGGVYNVMYAPGQQAAPQVAGGYPAAMMAAAMSGGYPAQVAFMQPNYYPQSAAMFGGYPAAGGKVLPMLGVPQGGPPVQQARAMAPQSSAYDPLLADASTAVNELDYRIKQMLFLVTTEAVLYEQVCKRCEASRDEIGKILSQPASHQSAGFNDAIKARLSNAHSGLEKVISDYQEKKTKLRNEETEERKKLKEFFTAKGVADKASDDNITKIFSKYSIDKLPELWRLLEAKYGHLTKEEEDKFGKKVILTDPAFYKRPKVFHMKVLERYAKRLGLDLYGGKLAGWDGLMKDKKYSEMWGGIQQRVGSLLRESDLDVEAQYLVATSDEHHQKLEEEMEKQKKDLAAFFKFVRAEHKIANIDVIVGNYAGRFDELWETLFRKWSVTKESFEEFLKGGGVKKKSDPTSGEGEASNDKEEEKRLQRKKLHHYYMRVCPDKATDEQVGRAIDKFSLRSSGGYDKMWRMLESKYGPYQTDLDDPVELQRSLNESTKPVGTLLDQQRGKLKEFYQRYAPEKTETHVDKVLSAFTDNYEQMWKCLHTKYGITELDSDEKRENRDKLKKYYAKYCPNKTDADVNATIEGFASVGFTKMWKLLEKKYGPVPPDEDEKKTEEAPKVAEPDIEDAPAMPTRYFASQSIPATEPVTATSTSSLKVDKMVLPKASHNEAMEALLKGGASSPTKHVDPITPPVAPPLPQLSSKMPPPSGQSAEQKQKEKDEKDQRDQECLMASEIENRKARMEEENQGYWKLMKHFDVLLVKASEDQDARVEVERQEIVNRLEMYREEQRGWEEIIEYYRMVAKKYNEKVQQELCKGKEFVELQATEERARHRIHENLKDPWKNILEEEKRDKKAVSIFLIACGNRRKDSGGQEYEIAPRTGRVVVNAACLQRVSPLKRYLFQHTNWAPVYDAGRRIIIYEFKNCTSDMDTLTVPGFRSDDIKKCLGLPASFDPPKGSDILEKDPISYLVSSKAWEITQDDSEVDGYIWYTNPVSSICVPNLSEVWYTPPELLEFFEEEEEAEDGGTAEEVSTSAAGGTFVRLTDADGCAYYWNIVTNETSYDCPEGAKAYEALPNGEGSDGAPDLYYNPNTESCYGFDDLKGKAVEQQEAGTGLTAPPPPSDLHEAAEKSGVVILSKNNDADFGEYFVNVLSGSMLEDLPKDPSSYRLYTAVYDESQGDFYYWNENTGSTYWEPELKDKAGQKK